MTNQRIRTLVKHALIIHKNIILIKIFQKHVNGVMLSGEREKLHAKISKNNRLAPTFLNL